LDNRGECNRPWGRTIVKRIILCSAMCIVVSACTTPTEFRTAQQTEPSPEMTDRAVVDRPPSPSNQRGTPVVGTPPEWPEPMIRPTGLATRLHDMVIDQIHLLEPQRSSATISVCLGPFENVSRAPSADLRAMLTHLAGVLNATPDADGTAFHTDDGSPDTTHRLIGTAFIITANGFDQWELYVKLVPSDRSWIMWEPSAPIRLIRQPRPHAPTVLAIPGN